MGYIGVILALTVLSFCSAEEGCPPARQISPCTCDGEGMSCISKNVTGKHIRDACNSGGFKYEGFLNMYIQGTSLDKIDPGLFGKLKFQTLYAELNKITSFEPKALDHTKNYLLQFSLFGNELTSFPYSSLSQFPRLATINLARNRITSIPGNAFTHNTLSSIIMAENQITDIGQNAFKNVPNLRRLELSSNRLTRLGPYSIALTPGPLGLQINLSNNTISDISNSAFDGGNPQVVFFSLNRLTSLKQEVFGTLFSRISPHGGVIEVSGNPLTCKGCDYSWIVTSRYVLQNLIIGFMCPDGTRIENLTSQKIGC